MHASGEHLFQMTWSMSSMLNLAQFNLLPRLTSLISGGGDGPGASLDAPTWLTEMLKKSVDEASKDARSFARSHAIGERQLITSWALMRMKWPPGSDAEQAELKRMHEVAATRTPAGIAAAQWWSKNGMTEAWETYIKQYEKRVGPKQAKIGQKLLEDTLMQVHHITQVAKSASARTRPYDVDPSLGPVIDKPGKSPSYPSGHTSAAVAAALVLAHLMPDRKDEFWNLAVQGSYARIYGGVHFPSDVEAGAKLAATIALYNVRTSSARQAAGTAKAA